MRVYYFAHQVYQFSYGIPIYRRLGGTFVVKKLKKLFQFKKFLRNGSAFPDVRTFLNTPPVIVLKVKELSGIEGTIISFSNTVINRGKANQRTIFVGHGTGDKKYGSNAGNLESYDYHFVSGPKHMAKLKDVEVNIPDERLIRVGNMRFDDYVNGRISREEVLDRLGVVDRTRKNILYAPTWKWGDGTFSRYVRRFCRELTEEFNLIIRPHHHDTRRAHLVRLWAAIRGIKHVYFSNPSDLVRCDTMYDFVASDIMISDTSSILYEYLITRRPIIIAKNDYDNLHAMPADLDIVNVAMVFDGSQNITKLVKKSLAVHDRKIEEYERMLHSCFYFNDGKSVDRAVEFVSNLSS